MHLVFRVIEPVRTLCAVRVRPLLEGVRTHGEADRDDRIAGFEQAAAPILRCRRCQPWLDSIVDKGIVSPFGDFVAERVNVL
jgi:hypothetical protein